MVIALKGQNTSNMAISPAFLDELRARVALHEVVGRKVRLMRAGREWKGLCPFHNEKSPSFYVNDEKGFYHCFGCGAHGDAVRFLCVAEGRGFRDAVEELAGAVGLELPRETPEDKERTARLDSLRAIMAAAQAWFADQLLGLSGADARAYLGKRGLSIETIRTFGLGFAPDSRGALKAALMGQGASADALVEAGLLIAVEDKTPYDRFRGRVMFPIRDPRGSVVAFGGRLLGHGEPKYLNSPDTPLFDKGRTLFNFDRAGPEARKSGQMLVVEGYMDVIALAQAGIVHAVAPLGTALTEDQMRLLWRVAAEPALCFDGDTAGKRAGKRAALRALPLLEPGKSLSFIDLPQGQDPDDVVRAGGSAAFNALAARRLPLVDRLWQAEHEEADPKTPEQRAAFRQQMRTHAQTIAHPLVRRSYMEEFRQRFDDLYARRSGPALPSSAIRANGPQQDVPLALLNALLDNPGWAADHAERLSMMRFDQSDYDRLWQATLDSALDLVAESAQYLPESQNESTVLDKARLEHNLMQSGFGELIAQVRNQQRLRFSFNAPPAGGSAAEQDFVAAVDLTIRLNEAREALEAATRTCQERMDEDALTALEAARRAERTAQAAWIDFGRQASANRLRGQA